MRVESANLHGRRVIMGMAARSQLGATRLAVVQLTRPYVEMGPSNIRKCCWPTWAHDARPTHVYCSAPVQEGSSWCPAHHGVVFRKEARDPNYETRATGGTLSGHIGLKMFRELKKAG